MRHKRQHHAHLHLLLHLHVHLHLHLLLLLLLKHVGCHKLLLRIETIAAHEIDSRVLHVHIVEAAGSGSQALATAIISAIQALLLLLLLLFVHAHTVHRQTHLKARWSEAVTQWALKNSGG